MTRIAALCLILSLAACAGSGADRDARDAQARFPGLPIPSGIELDESRSLAFNEGPNWNGRVSYSVNSSPADMAAWYEQAMPARGWQTISAVRGDNNVAVFRDPPTGRTATVEVRPMPLSGARIQITVAPAEGQAGAPPVTAPPAPAAGPAPLRLDVNPPPPAAAPSRDGVTATPLE